MKNLEFTKFTADEEINGLVGMDILKYGVLVVNNEEVTFSVKDD